jgi:serine/threonine-protein kinase
VVHRDVKPANIMLTAAGAVKVVDFGIARLQAAGQVTLTSVHQVVGTSLYLAPERAMGAPADARTDLYALGCVLYAMLTGSPPFTGRNPLEVLDRHLHQPTPPLCAYRSDIPPALEELVGELLCKDPTRRPSDARLVRNRLAGLACPTPVAIDADRHPPDHADLAGTRWARLRPGRATVLTLAAALVVVAGTVAVISRVTAPERPPIAQFRAVATPPAQPTDTAPAQPDTDPVPVSPDAPGGTADEITALRSLTDQQVRAGQLDRKAARDVYKKLDDITRRLGRNEPDDAGQKVAELNRKIIDLRATGRLSATGYHTLAPRVDRLASALPGDPHEVD